MTWLHHAMAWVGAHPHWSGALLAVVAFAESLAVVGLVVPGAMIMFGAGALAAGGGLSFWPLCAWAAAGAVAGDGVSFWLGRRYGERLAGLWPLRHYPEALERGVDFFRAHGGKSVLIGRFVGPVRPVIPAIAGMLRMSAPRFFVIDVLSAVVWAPAYLLPGMVFAASLGVAAAVAGRLVTLIVVLAIAGWMTVKVLARLHGLLRVVGARLAGRGATRSAIGTVLLDGAGVGWLLAVMALVAVYAAVAVADGAAGWERQVMAFAAAHRTETGRLVAWVITQFGSLAAVLACTAATLAVLVRRRASRSARALLASVALVIGATYLSKWGYAVARPLDPAAPGGFGYAFPSGHAAASAAIAFAVAVLVGPRGQARRPTAFALAAAFAALVALSRIYLGVHWPLDALGGFALGVTGAGVVALIRRESLPSDLRRRIAWLAPVALSAGALCHGWLVGEAGLRRYPPAWSIPVLSPHSACHRSMPGPAVGWVGDAASLSRALSGRWSTAPAWDIAGALRWLSPQPYLLATPVLPRLYAGRLPDLAYLKEEPDGVARGVLRAWRVARVGGGALWRIEVDRERLIPVWPLLLSRSTPVTPALPSLRDAGHLCPGTTAQKGEGGTGY